MKLEPDLRADFMAEAQASCRSDQELPECRVPDV